MPNTGWRAMRPEDLPVVAAISDAVHGSYAETQETYAERLALHPSGCFVYEKNGETLGILVTHPWYRGAPPALNAPLTKLPEPAEVYYLHDIALMSGARGTGAGADAIALTMEAARQAGVHEVHLMAVAGADRFWRANGFRNEALPADKQASYGPEARYMSRALP
jgi:GNAT superfamily N-acetyltransferase